MSQFHAIPTHIVLSMVPQFASSLPEILALKGVCRDWKTETDRIARIYLLRESGFSSYEEAPEVHRLSLPQLSDRLHILKRLAELDLNLDPSLTTRHLLYYTPSASLYTAFCHLLSSSSAMKENKPPRHLFCPSFLRTLLETLYVKPERTGTHQQFLKWTEETPLVQDIRTRRIYTSSTYIMDDDTRGSLINSRDLIETFYRHPEKLGQTIDCIHTLIHLHTLLTPSIPPAQYQRRNITFHPARLAFSLLTTLLIEDILFAENGFLESRTDDTAERLDDLLRTVSLPLVYQYETQEIVEMIEYYADELFWHFPSQ